MSDVTTILDLPDGDQLVLFGFSAAGPDRGAIARLSKGHRRWTAHAPSGDAQDAFVSMAMAEGLILADSFQGVRVSIDPDTGQVIDGQFVR